MKEKEQNFEDAMKKLEAIVEELESGDLPLTGAIKKYEDGMKLSQFCTKKLHDIREKIEILVKDSSGNFSTEDFASQNTDKPKNKKLKKNKKAEELLF